MDRAKLLELLPYGDAFLWVDRCCRIEPGRSLRAEMTYKPENPVLAAHFAHGPKVVPGCLIAEQVCQGALVLALGRDGSTQGQAYLLGKIQARFTSVAFMPCTVACDISIRSSLSGVILIAGTASTSERGEIAKIQAVATPLKSPDP